MKKYIIKRIVLILLGILMLVGFLIWLMACLFAVGQLYDTYNLWIFLKEAPVAGLVLAALLGASCALFVLAFRVKKPHAAKAETERIRAYEEILDRVNLAMDRSEEDPECLEGIRDDMQRLERYYCSPEWKEDFDADAAGLIPADLKRGVLSQDGIDHALERYRELAAALPAAGGEEKQ